MDEIYLYLFLKTALKSKIKHIYILNFLQELKEITTAPVYFLDLAINLFLCKKTVCKDLKNGFLKDFKNDFGTVYSDFSKRWKELFQNYCNNEELIQCIQEILSESERLQLYYKSLNNFV